MAKVLAFSAAALRAGVERVEKAQLELTAVIEPAARLGATGCGAGAAGDVPVWRGDDGRAPDPGADDLGPGPGGGDGAAGAAGLKGNSCQLSALSFSLECYWLHHCGVQNGNQISFAEFADNFTGLRCRIDFVERS
jgi:hypothetical protein